MATARRQLGYVSSLTTQTVNVQGYGVATGGSSSSISVGSPAVNYTLLTFTSDGTLTVTTAGLFDVLLIGPGGGGGSGGSGAGTSAGGGGGGGQIVGLDTTLTIYLSAGTFTMDVGAGQAGTSSYAALASVTDFAGRIQAIGGGVGGAYANTTGVSGVNSPDFRFARAGASGGGWAIGTAFVPDSVRNTVLSGFNGNVGGYGGQEGNTASTAAGGGGGAGSAGGNGSGSSGGSGGNGKDISGWITGSTYYACAGGGGGGSSSGGAAGLGGVAGKTSGAGNNATNYGAGGGGTYSNTNGGNGNDGAIFVRFKV